MAHLLAKVLKVQLLNDYKRVLLKLSGEALMGEKPYGIDPAIVQSIAEDVSKVIENNVQLAIVVGGGNIFRGCLLYTSPSPRDKRQSRMPSSA